MRRFIFINEINLGDVIYYKEWYEVNFNGGIVCDMDNTSMTLVTVDELGGTHYVCIEEMDLISGNISVHSGEVGEEY